MEKPPDKKINLFWFRRDIRLHNNRGLYEALNSGIEVIPVFIFDRHILDKLENKKDARVEFIHSELSKVRENLRKAGSDMLVYYGKPEEVWA